MASCPKVCRVFFVLANLFLLIVGGALALGTVLLILMPRILQPLYKPWTKELYLLALRNNFRTGYCYDTWQASRGPTAAINLFNISFPAQMMMTAFIAVGTWLSVWAIWGFTSLSRCCHKCFLVFYTLVQIVTMIVLPMAYLLIYYDQLLYPSIDGGLRADLDMIEKAHYHIPNVKPNKIPCSSFRLIFDALQSQGQCCGLDGLTFIQPRPLSQAMIEEISKKVEILQKYSPVCANVSGLSEIDILRLQIESTRLATEFKRLQSSEMPVQLQLPAKTAKFLELEMPGCWGILSDFLNTEILLWLGIVIGAICLALFISIITAIVGVAFWHRNFKKEMPVDTMANNTQNR